MSKFFERYRAACAILKEECDRQVKDGELTEDEANFRYYMVRDEILMDMPDED